MNKDIFLALVGSGFTLQLSDSVSLTFNKGDSVCLTVEKYTVSFVIQGGGLVNCDLHNKPHKPLSRWMPLTISFEDFEKEIIVLMGLVSRRLLDEVLSLV